MQDSYTTEQCPNAVVEVDNTESKLAVEKIEGTMWRSIRICDDGGHTKFVKTKICSSEGVGVAVGEALKAENAVSLELNLPAERGLVENTCTTDGKLIECMFSIECKAHMEGCCMCCGQTPAVSCPMTLHTGMMMVPVAPEPPPGWNPVMIPMVSFEYSAQYDYAPSAPQEGEFNG